MVRQNADGTKKELDSKQTHLKGPGKYRVRFANFDERLTLWVDGELPFGEGVVYDAPTKRNPTEQNDLQPANIGVKGAAVAVEHLKLWRNTYYTNHRSKVDLVPNSWSDSADWENLGKPGGETYYVYPGHYLALGDNSPESSDGRYWGLVPERLLLGRALLVYYPFWPFGNRAGPIK